MRQTNRTVEKTEHLLQRKPRFVEEHGQLAHGQRGLSSGS